MYPNLKAEIARKGYREKDIAKKIGISSRTLSNKIAGRSDFTLSEMLSIKQNFFPDLTLEYLFQRRP